MHNQDGSLTWGAMCVLLPLQTLQILTFLEAAATNISHQGSVLRLRVTSNANAMISHAMQASLTTDEHLQP